MDAKHQLVKDWLNKARRDLLSAKRLYEFVCSLLPPGLSIK